MCEHNTFSAQRLLKKRKNKRRSYLGWLALSPSHLSATRLRPSLTICSIVTSTPESEDLAPQAAPLIFDPSQSDEMCSFLVRMSFEDYSIVSEPRARNLATLEMAAEKRSIEDGERAAHTLKSSSRALGLLALSNLWRRLNRSLHVERCHGLTA